METTKLKKSEPGRAACIEKAIIATVYKRPVLQRTGRFLSFIKARVSKCSKDAEKQSKLHL